MTEKKLDRLVRYHELFDEECKARAFDKIAEQFYAGNFGHMSKTDFETLLFSIYIERILEVSEDDMSSYSDYRLAKELGISQARISNLKVKKQLQYPREFNWREAFARISKYARYESGKIKLQIPDINLYYEIKNIVEENGGYIDVTLTSKLLQLSPEYFLDLLLAVSDGKDRTEVKKELRKEIRKQNKDLEYLEQEPIGKQLGGFGRDVAISIISDFANNTLPISGYLMTLIKNIAKVLNTMPDKYSIASSN